MPATRLITDTAMALNTEVATGRQLYLEAMLAKLNLTMAEWLEYRNFTGTHDDDDLTNLNFPINATDQPMCGETIHALRQSYRPIHGYLAVAVCIFGTVANLFNIAVLSRKDMATPTNKILTGLAVADLLVMVEYIPFALLHYLQPDPELAFTFRITAYVLFHSHFGQIFHTVAIWMTVMLAVWRFISIRYPHLVSQSCNMHRTKIYIALAYFMSPIICIPSYFMFTLIGRKTANGTLYRIATSKVALAHGELLRKLNFYLYSIIIKLVPCLLLTYFSVMMIRVLLETKRRKVRLASGGAQGSQSEHHLQKLQRQTDRTTRMLVAVLLLFLVTEFPQGILAAISAAWPNFFENCYTAAGELMDILALINSAVNFLLYCFMSKQFRTAMRQLLRLHKKPCHRPSPGAATQVHHVSRIATDTTFV